MSGTDEGEKRRGAGRSGTAGSIGKELGEDLDFEADALLDSLLSDDSIAPNKSTRPPPAKPASEAPPPSEGRVLHAPQSREFPDDEPTWVGNLDAETSLELQQIAAVQTQHAKRVAIVPWQLEEPVGVARLRQLAGAKVVPHEARASASP